MDRRGIGTLFLMIGFIYAQAQSNRVLQNLSPSYKWYQVKTAHFKIIYPEGFSEQGRRMANTMEHIYKPGAASLAIEPKKNFPLILQNQNAVANGFVTLGPRRSEFYTMSPQRANFLGNNDWLDLLAVHEYRHVVQFDKSRTGFTGFIRNLFGEYSQAAIASSVVPSWFWEGDAVGIETALSASGRGRIPQFSAAFRANLLEKGPYNYNKQYLRSFKDFIPNHYVLGYHYATYLKNEYGAKVVEDMVKRSWALPFIPFTFSFAQQKYGAKKMPEMYLDMMAQLKIKWAEQQEVLDITPFKKVNSKPKKVYTNYNYPQILDNGNLLVMKSGLGNYLQFVEIDVNSGEEKVIFTPGSINDAGMFSAAGGMVVWNEFDFDARWRQKTFSVIKTYNVATDQYRVITKKSRYSSASIAPDRSKIATIEEMTDYSNRLVILDAYSGDVKYTYDAPNGSFFQTPVWRGAESVVLSEVAKGLKQIIEINTVTGNKQILLGPSSEQISYAIRKNDDLFYVSGVTGIDNIYNKNLKSGLVTQVTSSKYGAYNPVISNNGKTLYYNELTVLGNDVVKIDLNPASWIAANNLPNTNIHFYQPMVEMEGHADILKNVPDSAYQEHSYRKKLFKLHSWGPYLSNSINELEAGLYSTNVLSTNDMFLGFRMDTDFNFKWIARTSYQSLYPIIDVEANYAKRNASINFRDSTGAVLTDFQNWDEIGVKAGLRIPWLLTHNKFHTNIIIQNYFGLTKVDNFRSSYFNDKRILFSQLNNGNLNSNEFKLTFSSLHKQSIRDIHSRFGSVFIVENYSTPYGGDFKGGLTALKTQLYFPGFFKHHSFNVFAGFQHNNITLDNNNYWFANRMPYPRSVSARTFEDFYTIRFNYDLPLLYPDLSIGPWLYIQRVKTKLFYDYGYGKTDVIKAGYEPYQVDQEYFSTGAELTFDFNFMRALPKLELGVRYAYQPTLGVSKFEFLIGSFGF